MIRHNAIVLCALTALSSLSSSACTWYTSCPENQRLKSGQCVAEGNPSSGNPNGGEGTVPPPPDPSIRGTIPVAEWSIGTGNLAGMATDYGDICNVSSKPDEDELIAGVSAKGLWASHDGGQSWQALGTNSSSVPVSNRPSMIYYDPDDPSAFWEAGSYGEGVFRTKDNGDTFVRLGTVVNTDGIGIDFTDPERKTLLASVHESGHDLYRTDNGGSDWQNITDTIPVTVNRCNFPVVLDSQTYLFGCSQYGGGMGGVFRTADAGRSWVNVTTGPGWAPPLLSSDGSIYWSLENDGGLMRSTDQGLTWTSVIGGTLSIYPIELPDGSIVTMSKQYVLISSDHGATWSYASSLLPFLPAGIAYSAFQKAFFIWHLAPDNTIPEDSIMRYDFDYQL